MNYLLFLSLLVAAVSCTPKPTTNNPDTVKAAYIHEYGVSVDDAADWHERGASGQVIQKLKSGSVQTENWKSGKRHGITTLTFPHSQDIQTEAFYDNGKLLWVLDRYRSGMPKKQVTYNVEGVNVSTWYEEGSPKSIETYENALLTFGNYFTPAQDLEAHIQQGNGERIIRDGYGQLEQKEVFTNGERTLQINFHPNGMPKSHIPYVAGKIEGTKKTFLPDGEPATIEAWHEGAPHGITILFENSEQVAAVPYIAGQKEGIEKQFRPGTTEVVAEISWKENRRHGPSTVTIDSEKVTDWYLEGKKVRRSEYLSQGS